MSLVYIGIPSADGKPHKATVDSLLAEQLLGFKQGVHFYIDWEVGCGLVGVARNRIANRFLAFPHSDTLVFVDSDISWKGGELARLAARKQPVIGGTYRTKTNLEYRFHVRGPTEKKANGLVSVKALPTGFLKISKKALKRINATPYRHGVDETHYDYFPTGVFDGEMWGEDYGFCRLWLETGNKLWLDPSIQLRHWDGQQFFEGDPGEWLA